MPIIDMPIQDLLQYQGKNPRPYDFDAYWDAGIKEMRALGTDCEMVPSEFKTHNVECFDVFFKGVNGSRVHGYYVRPIGKAGCPGVAHFHGYGGKGAGFMELMSWAAAGYCAISLSCRGQSGLSEDLGTAPGNTLKGHIIRGLDSADPKDLYYRQVFLDTAQIVRILASFEEVDEKRIAAMGGSQGGALTLACAALAPEVKRAAPVYPFLCDYQRVWEMDLDVAAYEELRWYFRAKDPEHKRREEVFTKLGYIDCHHLAPRINADILMGVGLMDTVCPPSSQFAAYNNIPAQKNYVLYPDFGHEQLPDFTLKTMEFFNQM